MIGCLERSYIQNDEFVEYRWCSKDDLQSMKLNAETRDTIEWFRTWDEVFKHSQIDGSNKE